MNRVKLTLVLNSLAFFLIGFAVGVEVVPNHVLTLIICCIALLLFVFTRGRR